MCTPVLSAYTNGCNSTSGVESIYMIDKKARETAAVAISVTAGAGTISGTGGTAYLWQPLQTGNFSFTQPITQDQASGTTSVLQTLTGKLDGYSAALVYLSGELRKGRFEAVIKMRSGVYIYAGLDFAGLQVAGGDGGRTGAGANDPNGIEINLTCESKSEAPTIDFQEFNAAFNIETA